MKALVYHGPGERAWEDVPDPTIQVQPADGPEAFYRHLGFTPTGEFDENSEVILALKLTTSGSTAAGSASRR